MIVDEADSNEEDIEIPRINDPKVYYLFYISFGEFHVIEEKNMKQ